LAPWDFDDAVMTTMACLERPHSFSSWQFVEVFDIQPYKNLASGKAIRGFHHIVDSAFGRGGFNVLLLSINADGDPVR